MEKTHGLLMDKFAEPFFFKGNEEGCLLIHGFTGSPGRMRHLGERLNKKGYSVHGCRLKGHGTSLEDMSRTNWRDWLMSAREGYEFLVRQCERIHIIGFSMGALLGLILASERAVDRLVVINTALRYKDPLIPFAGIYSLISKYSAWEDPTDYDEKLVKYNIGYSGSPNKSVPGLLRIRNRAERNLRNVVSPILIIQAQNDESLRPESARILYKGVASREKELFWLYKSTHQCTLGREWKSIHDRILDFLKG